MIVNVHQTQSTAEVPLCKELNPQMPIYDPAMGWRSTCRDPQRDKAVKENYINDNNDNSIHANFPHCCGATVKHRLDKPKLITFDSSLTLAKKKALTVEN